ncbi:hypothetical protein WN66_04672 [Saccharomyces cerevisiae]|nr:hypothetical protein WN66_04672 [Saccharomyces cerevisiae]
MYNVPPTNVSTVKRCNVSVTLVYQAYLDMTICVLFFVLFLSPLPNRCIDLCSFQCIYSDPLRFRIPGNINRKEGEAKLRSKEELRNLLPRVWK